MGREDGGGKGIVTQNLATVLSIKVKRNEKCRLPRDGFNSSGMEKPKFCETPSLSPSKSLITFHYRITFTFNYSVKYNVFN